MSAGYSTGGISGMFIINQLDNSRPTPAALAIAMRILLTHSPDAFASYYGERALAALKEAGEVRMHRGAQSLEGEPLLAAAQDCALIVSYRQSPAPAALFERLPGLVAFLRCAVDIRNVDVPAASKAGVLVTQASAGFVPAVAELPPGYDGDGWQGIYVPSATPKEIIIRLNAEIVKVLQQSEVQNKLMDLGLQPVGNSVTEFAKISAPAIGFPYVRAFMSTLSIQAGLPPIILPSINFIQFSKELEKEKAEKK